MEPLSTSQPPLWLLKKYRTGQCSAEEELLIDSWFESEDNYSENSEIQQELEEIHSRILTMIRVTKQSRSSRIRRIRLIASAAASLLAFIGIWYSFHSRKILPVNIVTIATNAGQQKKITLPDGSAVWLNSCSQIQFDNEFRTSRKIYLKGEAFFDVVSNESSVFQVITDSLQVKVLGTRFNFAAYANNNFQLITLENGKVAVFKNNGNEATILHPGTSLLYSARQIQVKKADMESVTAWQKGLLIYKNTSLSEICKDLERRYNVSIHISNHQLSSALYHYTSRQISLNNVLKVLSETGNGFRYQVNQNNIIIY